MWQLVLSANKIMDKEKLVEPVSVLVQQEDLLFPIAVSDTYLIAQYPVLYEGPYMEDGSGEYVADVAAIVLFNTARTGIEQASVELKWECGKYIFEAQMIPPRESVMVLEKNRQKFVAHRWLECTGTQSVGEGEWLSQQDISAEEAGDIDIYVKNMTDKQLTDVRIYYKSYLPGDKLYIGGITYCAGIETLRPGEHLRIQPYRYVKDYSRIVRLVYCG